MSGVVGFIGLGQMGQRMARNLLACGTRLVVHDVDKAKLEEFRAGGAIVAESPAEVAAASSLIVTMLPNSQHVETVFTASKLGILESIKRGTLCIDCSTIDQNTALSVAKKVAEKRASFVDAPVSGGVLGAQNATLTFMVGGDIESFDRSKPLLMKMGKNTIHCGVVGSGQAVKLCNNMLLAITMVGVVEAAHLGAKMGLNLKTLMSVINTSTGRCWSTDTYNPVPDIIPGTPACNEYSGGFSGLLMAKDLGLAQNASTSLKVPTPMGSLAHQLYLLLSKNPDFCNKDFTSIYKFMEQDQKTLGTTL